MAENKVEQKLKEKIAQLLPCFRDIFDKMPCPYDGECGKCGDTREAVDHLAVMLKEAGYVQLSEDQKLPSLPKKFRKHRSFLSIYDIGWGNGYAWVIAKISKDWRKVKQTSGG